MNIVVENDVQEKVKQQALSNEEAISDTIRSGYEGQSGEVTKVYGFRRGRGRKAMILAMVGWAGYRGLWWEDAANLSSELLAESFLEHFGAHIPTAPDSPSRLAGSRCRAQRDFSEEQGRDGY